MLEHPKNYGYKIIFKKNLVIDPPRGAPSGVAALITSDGERDEKQHHS
jgi:hypothetical protein